MAHPDGIRRKISPHHPMLDWPKPLGLELPVVCLTGILSLPPSFPPPAQARGRVLGRTCPWGASPARVGSDGAAGHLLCFCQHPQNIRSVPAEGEQTQPRGRCGLALWRLLRLEERRGHPYPDSCPDGTRFQAKALVCAFVIPVVITLAQREGFGWVSRCVRSAPTSPGDAAGSAQGCWQPPPPPPHPASQSSSPWEGLA